MSRRVVSALCLALVLAALSSGCTSIRTRIWMNAGNKLYKAQKYEDAIVQYQRIVSVDPTNWPASYQIAMSYLALYHPGSTHPKDLEFADKATAALEKLLKMQAPDPETAEKLRNFYIGHLHSADKTDKLIGYYDELLAKEPRNTSLMAQLAEIYDKKGDFENSLKYYQKRAEVDPNNKEAWYTIGVECWARSYRMKTMISLEERESVIETGMKALLKALSLEPEYTEALAYINLMYREKAQVLSAQQKNEEAGDAIAKADEYQKKTLELMNRKKQQAAAQKAAG